MGACSVFMTVNSTDIETVRNAFADKQERCRDEYGNDPYNGTFSTFHGIDLDYKKFVNENEARRYILDKSEKWGNAIAVIVDDEKGRRVMIGGWAAE